MASKPEYKLTYFNSRGLAEATRFLFKYGGIDFEDNRITKEEWAHLKEKAYFGKIPTLEYKGRLVGQSISIARYVGKLINLGGKTDWENLEIDAIVDTIDEIRQKFMPLFSETDPERKKALSNTFYNETLPFYLSRLEATVERNNGYLALNRLTWADLFFANYTTNFNQYMGGEEKSVYANYPNLKALSDKIYAFPAIKKWVEERPDAAT